MSNNNKRGDYLRLTSKINEEIKYIVDVSAAINLTAINAMLVSRRAGERSLGYGVVSAELRIFSQRLDENMRGLTLLISELVREVALFLNQLRNQRLLDDATTMSSRTKELIGFCLSKKQHQIENTRQKIRQCGDDLRQKLDSSLKLCQLGSALARSAKIESVYGASMATTLSLVSQEIEERMMELLGRFKSINNNMQVWQV